MQSSEEIITNTVSQIQTDVPLPNALVQLGVPIPNELGSNKPSLDVNMTKRRLLLRMCNARFEQGELRQAIDGYLGIIADYPQSEESHVAQDQLLTIAQHYEQEGSLRLSLDVIEQLEQTVASI